MGAMSGTAAIVNQKGGVGKTTVTLGLASAAREQGHRVLVVDLDPQGASTWVLGCDPEDVTHSVADAVKSGKKGAANRAVVRSEWGPLVDVIPSVPDLQHLEAIRGRRGTTRLRTALDGVRQGYGIVLIDCPPSLGDLTTNGLASADEVLVVVEPSVLSLRGVAAVADVVDDVWDRVNGDLDLAGVIVNRMPPRSAEADRQWEELNSSVGASSVWEPPIPQRVVLAEAASQRRPIHEMGSRGRETADVFDLLYAQLWDRLAAH